MDRFSRRSFVRLSGAIALAAPLVAASTGCNLVAMGLYLVQGMNQPAKFDGLRGKRVAVVCRPISTLQYRNSTVHRELGEDAYDLRGSCGFSFGNGCSDGRTETGLFGGTKRKAKTPMEVA